MWSILRPHHLLVLRSRALTASADNLQPTTPTRVVVLASGAGTLLKSLIDASRTDGYPAQIVAVGVDRDCAATEHGEAAGIPVFKVSIKNYDDRANWDKALTAAVAAHRPDLVVSAGFMKILGPSFLAEFGGRIINTHPALLPAFPGAHAVPDAMAYGVKVTGSTVHLVDGGVDTGPILAQEPVAVLPGDTESTLHERIKVVERRLLADVIAAVATHGVVSDGRKAVIPSE
ncbi:phosphoribosylglycinamide formyltransferase [Rhodococcus sp. IEGM 1379]|uniref:phosphoribosylglycinamide formyltransferase n=1 Tax=Rhodococcus sp. IEGM 1379 TaxID=3047086 RepID=UPI0024B811FD|nr:phosphoribosylglycinamide formyltransferase [Rhodococcus sp. IEGM 1379]MDI9915257.1 phosphoribosylglycinamide formyltransferase [Rhodococcus sp. IEGM 1379]